MFCRQLLLLLLPLYTADEAARAAMRPADNHVSSVSSRSPGISGLVLLLLFFFFVFVAGSSV
jgi:hypothetical protein